MEHLSSSDDEEMGEEELTGLEAKMARQAKLMKQRVGMSDDEDDEDDEEEKQKAVWGRGKKVYYGADNVNRELDSSDEELAAEEEEVARQAQQEQAAALRNEDFEFSDDEDEEEEQTFEEAAQKKEKETKKKAKKDKVLSDGTIVLKKDISALSKNELMEVLMSDAPELVGLQTDLQDSLNELRLKVQPLLEKVRGGQLATEDGLKYLELKHMLLLSYCQAIVFYFLLKAEMPQNVRDHPVVRRLVDLKLSLERLRPVEEKLQKQIDKLMTMNIAEETSEIKAKKASSQALEKAAKNSKKRKASVEEMANGANNGHLEEEADVLPIESQNMMNERKRLEARVQEDVAARVPSSNAERKKAKLHKSTTGLTRMADDLDDDVERDNTGLKSFNGLSDAKPRTLSQVIAEAGKPFKKPQIISGDADLPVREELGDRRRKLEIQKTNKELANREDDDSDDDNEAEVNEPEVDDFYKQAVLLKEAKAAAKQAKYSRTILVPVEEEDAEGKRSITWQMEKNRGLTPHRKKANKNPRKKYKLKHEKAVIRRKGQVRDIRQATTNYGGEASGIRTNISRSVRFKN